LQAQDGNPFLPLSETVNQILGLFAHFVLGGRGTGAVCALSVTASARPLPDGRPPPA